MSFKGVNDYYKITNIKEFHTGRWASETSYTGEILGVPDYHVNYPVGTKILFWGHPIEINMETNTGFVTSSQFVAVIKDDEINTMMST